MSPFKVTLLVFSPGGNTLAAAKMAETALSERGLEIQLLDLTAARVIKDQQRLREYLDQEVRPHDLIMVGGPVYEDRMDRHTLNVIKALPVPGDNRWGIFAIPFITWGGVTPGIALHQQAKALRASGRKVVTAFQVEGFHPFSAEWPAKLNVGMPGDETKPLMAQLAHRVSKIAVSSPVSLPDITGKLDRASLMPRLVGTLCSLVPTQDYLWLDPRVKPESCRGCGQCVRHCPLDRLEILDGKSVTASAAARCMHCYTCIRVCPSRSRSAWLGLTRIPLMAMRKMYADRPGNIIYF